jgi:hypothetical protein
MLSGDDLTIVLFLVGTAISIALTAMSAAGWRHPALIGGLFSLAGVCLVIGVAWPALKTISPPATAMVNQVATNPVAWFIVLMLAVAAPLVRPKRNNPASRTPAVVAATPVSEATSVPHQPQRVFIDVSPAYLMDLYKNRTSIQGDALAAAYIGKWLVVTGRVRDIYGSVDARVALVYDKDDRFISVTFTKEASEKVSQIEQGATITVRGEITNIDLPRLKLQNCDLDKIGTG